MEMVEARARGAIIGYNKTIREFVNKKGIPKEQQSFILKLLGVGNYLVEGVNIFDLEEVKKVAEEVFKERGEYDKSVIRNYLRSQKTKKGKS